MNLYTKLVSGVLFPLQEYLKKHNTVAIRKQMEVSQWWPEEQLKKFQLARLRKLLTHAQTHVPYYRQLFNEIGVKPEEINSLNDLASLPFLDKSKIRVDTDALKSDCAIGLSKFNTGGSSGEPLIFYIGKQRVSHDVAAKWRATRWWNVDIGDKEIVVWGSPIELGAQDGVRGLRDKLLRTTLLTAFEMSPQKLEQFLKIIRSTRPKMLFGYPSALSYIANYAEENGQTMNNLGFKVAFVTSERLYDDQREIISRVFGCPVANGYGGRDAGFIAHECPEGGIHITAEDIIVEIIDPQGHILPVGKAGEITVTHLATSDFPFIRYRTGDIGVLDDKQCKCGRGLPLLKEIQGRSTDFLVTHDGTVMHGLALIYILRDLPQIRTFKIVQESIDLTRVSVVSDNCLTQPLINQIRNGFKERLGQNVEIVIEEVTGIVPEKSGKFRYVISKVAPN